MADEEQQEARGTDAPPLLDFNELNDEKEWERIGCGTYGEVYKVLWNRRIVAVKKFHARVTSEAIAKEIKQHWRVNHPNIVQLFGTSKHDKCQYLIMEYGENGSLHIFLHGEKKPEYTRGHALNWLLQCAEAVAFMHAMKPKPLIHRDLKPQNLLLLNGARTLKICDFGTAVDKRTEMTNNRGSAPWMAPEVFLSNTYTEKCDVYSYGIVLWELLSRNEPFADRHNKFAIRWQVLMNDQRPPLTAIENCPQDIEKLIKLCWATEPKTRPSMQKVVAKMTELKKKYSDCDKAIKCNY